MSDQRPGEAAALELDAIDELGGDMLGVGGAAAVAEDQQLVAALEGSGDRLDRFDEGVDLSCQEPTLGRDASGKNARDVAG